METVSLEIGGFLLLHPTTVVTNLLLALECWILSRRLRPAGGPPWVPEVQGGEPGDALDSGAGDRRAVDRRAGDRRAGDRRAGDPRAGDLRAADLRAGSWSGFLFFMGIATLVGAAKDGVPHYLAGVPFALTVFVSDVASGLGVFYAEVATIHTYLRPGPVRRWLRRGAMGQLAVFALVLALNRSFLVVTANTALGLVPVMVAETLAFRRGHWGSGWVAGGLAFSLLTALVYLFTLSIHPWFDHIDLAHVMMMASLLAIYRGVRIPRGA